MDAKQPLDRALEEFAKIDPQRLWNELDQARQRKDWETVRDRGLRLQAYLDVGGQPPHIGVGPKRSTADALGMARVAVKVMLEWAERGGPL